MCSWRKPCFSQLELCIIFFAMESVKWYCVLCFNLRFSHCSFSYVNNTEREESSREWDALSHGHTEPVVLIIWNSGGVVTNSPLYLYKATKIIIPLEINSLHVFFPTFLSYTFFEIHNLTVRQCGQFNFSFNKHYHKIFPRSFVRLDKRYNNE